MATLTNRKLEVLNSELEDLYEGIEGSDPDSNYYHSMAERISEKHQEIAEERIRINDLSFDQ